MTAPDDDLLATTEGVQEGSAASAAEGPGSGAAPAAGTLPAPGEAEPAAPPVDVTADEDRGPGQQLQVGEG